MSADPANSLSQQAIAVLNAGQPREAIALLKPACDGGSDDPRHWFLLGAAQGMTGNLDAAEQAFRKTLMLNPSHTEALSNLGRALAQQGRNDESVDTMRQALAINPGHRQARIGLVNALTQLQRYEDAEENCGLLLDGSQMDAEALTLLGNIRKAKGDPGRALEKFEQALRVDPGNVSALMNKGLVLRALGRDEEALSSFTHASRLAPGNAMVWFIRGMTHIGLNLLEHAAEDLEHAFRLNPGDVDAGGQLANVYRHLRRLPESIEVSRKILAVDPGNSRARFYLEAFGGGRDGNSSPQRIPRQVAEAAYSQSDVGKNFEASLKGGLEYRAPDVLNDAVRKHCGGEESSLDILEIGCGTGLCGSRFADIARTLVGTDLSPSMLEVAREKDAYTDLYVADLVDVLSCNPGKFDLVIAMDVLCYFGNLGEIFRKCRDTLRANGVFAFSVERPDGDEPWQLHPYGHFVHSLAHIRQVADAAGFREEFVKEMVLRREALEPRTGYIGLFRRESKNV
jgi:predicted TPR repeat methyltransferase